MASACLCAELFQQLWQPCILPPCPTFIWSFSDWQCDNRGGCGGGTARRNATCIIASTSQAVAPSMCPESLLDASTQACAQAPCVVFYWRARELADCLPEEPSKPCGRVSAYILCCPHEVYTLIIMTGREGSRSQPKPEVLAKSRCTMVCKDDRIPQWHVAYNLLSLVSNALQAYV